MACLLSEARADQEEKRGHVWRFVGLVEARGYQDKASDYDVDGVWIVQMV